MTDYGRGSGSEPWHPEDPLFGDQGYQQPAHQGQYGQEQPPGGYDPYGTAQQPQYPYAGHESPQQHPQQERYDQYPPHQQLQHQQHQQPQQQYGGWETGAGQPAYGPDSGDPYGGPPADPYGGGQPDFYGQGGYPPPQPPQHRQYPQDGRYPEQAAYPQQDGQDEYGRQRPDQNAQRQAPPTPESDPWSDEASEPEEHAFFAGGSDEDGASSTRAGRRGEARRGGDGGRKRRSGMACLVVLTVLAGGVATVGYFGYTFYENHFGPAPDFSGEGTGDVQVQIPKGATLNTMGNILKREGVVKSVDAFVEAAGKNPKGQFIQAGVYLLHKQMSAAAAVTMMTDPKAQSAIIVPEGMRDVQVYAAIDLKLGLPEGTTKKVAHDKAKSLGLPEWADSDPKIKDPLEGFLFPSRYGAAKGMKPEDVLRQMVAEADRQYGKYDLEAEAKKLGLDSPLQVITVASLVQAEGKTHDDFRKMARVIYNRLQPNAIVPNRKLEFDSTYNYLKGQSKINLTLKELRGYDDPYNTYYYSGITPGPIGNPGKDALDATIDPAVGKWYFFVSVDGEKTQFAETLEEHDRLVEEFNKKQRDKG